MSKTENSWQDHFDKENEIKLVQETAWVRQASQGDPIALTKIYELYIDNIYHYCYSQVGNISEAEALTSEVFTRAIEVLLSGKYQWQNKPLGAWLYGIAANVVREYSRESMNAPIIEGLDHNEPVSERSDILEILIQKEKQDTLWQLIKELALGEQRILILRHVYDLPYAGITQVLGRILNACKQLHYRAMRKLKLKVQETDLWSEITKVSNEVSVSYL